MTANLPAQKNGGVGFEIKSEWVLFASKEEVFAIVGDPALLPLWWGAVFMRVEFLTDVRTTSEGCLVRLYTKGLLPHTFEFIARISSADGDRFMVVETMGDFKGRGDIEIIDQGEIQTLTFRWRVLVSQPYIRPFLKVLKPVFVFNHRWAMRQGRRGLQEAIDVCRKGEELRTLQVPSFPHNLPFIRDRHRFSRAEGSKTD